MRTNALWLAGAMFLSSATLAVAGTDLFCDTVDFDISAMQEGGRQEAQSGGEVKYFAPNFCNRVILDYLGRIQTDVLLVNYNKSKVSKPQPRLGTIPTKGMDPVEIFNEFIVPLYGDVVLVRVTAYRSEGGEADLWVDFIKEEFMQDTSVEQLTN